MTSVGEGFLTMDSYFAPAERTNIKELTQEIKVVGNNPLVSGLLLSVGGLLAVLDEHRQIVAYNDSFLKMIGVENPSEAMGLRPGEAIQCVHAHEEEGGCGTSKFCSTCGAAIAIVSSLVEEKSIERICALSAKKNGKVIDLALLVRAQSIIIDSKTFVLLFIQDITQQQQRAALERTFFHDINNMLTILTGASQLLVQEEPSELAQTVHLATTRLKKEISIQQCLSQSESSYYQPLRSEISTTEIIAELKSFFSIHPTAHKKNIRFHLDAPDLLINVDISLLSRILCNMIINALEATDEDGTVKIWLNHDQQHLSFYVWNEQEISADVARRIFQRNFSTKSQEGRGIGTFSMKLFGEEVLGGKVDFTSSKEDGTTFIFSLPL